MSDTADVCDNRGGHIIGDVFLSGGDDTFDNRGGRVDGIVTGGTGNDIYIVDGTPLAIRERAGQGSDTIKAATVSLDLAKYFSIENATLLGGLALDATGDEEANTLTGNLGVNVLKGLAGNDSYVVQNKDDRVIEVSGGGTDTVIATVSYELTAGQSIERFKADTLVGAVDLTGNALGQIIAGNASSNVIDGRGGNDTLTGGSGKVADTFVFSTALGTGNVDRITDYSAADDTIQLSKAIFTALSGGALASSAFKDLSAVDAKVDADDRILYDKAMGALFYDADGSGSKAAVQFAILDNKAAIAAADFFVFAS
ncbi:hypothetical protein ASG52_01070 [Methylobacterium sp. Leaf456]|nr:hypothetical protein ASG52_01070 [Methylobacterium sp. Leaf456]